MTWRVPALLVVACLPCAVDGGIRLRKRPGIGPVQNAVTRGPGMPYCVAELRKLTPLSRHPLLGARVSRVNATTLLQSIAERRRATVLQTASELRCPHTQLLYLSLGEPGDRGAPRPQWHGQVGGNNAQLLHLSGDRPMPGSIHFPGSTAAERRNIMYAVAMDQEERQAWAFDFIVFVHYAAFFTAGDLRSFERMLFAKRPAVGVPLSGCETQYSKSGVQKRGCQLQAKLHSPFATTSLSDVMVAYHRVSHPALWPLDAALDSGACEGAAQWAQTVRAQMLLSGGVVVDTETAVQLPKGVETASEYRRQGCATWHWVCSTAHAMVRRGAIDSEPLRKAGFRVPYSQPVRPGVSAPCLRPHAMSCTPPDLSAWGGPDFRVDSHGGAAAQTCITDVFHALEAARQRGLPAAREPSDECWDDARPNCVRGEARLESYRPAPAAGCPPPVWPPVQCDCEYVCEGLCEEVCRRLPAQAQYRLWKAGDGEVFLNASSKPMKLRKFRKMLAQRPPAAPPPTPPPPTPPPRPKQQQRPQPRPV
eukprot:TRINITY_DN43315_c0_g1_i1.p1 TRINITY_DN43315_c0_g1~~TRINITY_DN43315_c0_g1_i1.p1  ORF type:complete len:535 (+),score=139.03 TRINITY_DN43315_c0_g1_i1:55-1659(+)